MSRRRTTLPITLLLLPLWIALGYTVLHTLFPMRIR